jgi:hypothetical protein
LPITASCSCLKGGLSLLVCVKCGTQNPDGMNYCTKCKSQLPRIPHTAQVHRDPEKVMERYNQLKEAADMMKSGEWTEDQFGDFLENISMILSKKEQEIRDIEIPEEAYDDFSEELEVGFKGITLYNEGISHMLLYLDDQDFEHIEYGLDLVYEGNELINEAIKVNRRNRRKLEEMYIDTSTTI